eukprot:CAMPEP_0203794856 /NCGR_PEP_ID=MMETSP0100_2-20121128/6813_1 /ASSEMBLY_ACC=CAM_ASM_000210 /TAXON_ID=96639 /ORGANISM=" , Strain NY0313808BC1" /LENGTH=77 /DNA_ID=CAMNT_0050699113 /DNA_START=639 /DNA_END=872 /DNA_ORIENTATION=+
MRRGDDVGDVREALGGLETGRGEPEFRLVGDPVKHLGEPRTFRGESLPNDLTEVGDPNTEPGDLPIDAGLDLFVGDK